MDVAALALKLARTDPLGMQTLYWGFDGREHAKTYNPSQPLNWSGGLPAFSESCRLRYGFGAPYKLDPAAAPALSVLPDADHDLHGWWGEEGQEWLTEEAAHALGLDLPLSPTDKTDLKALGHLMQTYIYPLLDRVPPAPPSPPVVLAPTHPLGSTSLSMPEQRVDELWAWVNQQWPIVRPAAIQALKMFRKAIGH